MSAQEMTMEKEIRTSRGLAEEASGTSLGGRIDQARERATGVYERARSRVMDKEAELEGYVRVHPVRSVLVAAGIGAGVGLLFGVLASRR